MPFAAVTPTARAGPVLFGTEVPTPLVAAVALGGAALGLRAIKKVFDTPSRTYDGQNVGKEYDAWTREGILEHYWGEHIHLGYYTEEVGHWGDEGRRVRRTACGSPPAMPRASMRHAWG